ncbi:nucleotide disphospho-sugar-binding domain-containing protein [Streptomyces sp. NPDC059176]|uniref:nucleotide disphospho-sugar-binding domain-containing protein n=1 Tax=unclassified Streptomyces TaxID=2593676 RepID=UPI00367AF942
MRVLFTVAGWSGHYYCMVPVGWALQAAGHEVRVACQPELAACVARSGLTPLPVLRSADLMRVARFAHLLKSAEGRRALPGLPLPLHPLTGALGYSLSEIDIAAVGAALWRDLAAHYRESADAAVDVARSWSPDLVCHSLMSEEGPLAAAVRDVPAVFLPPGLFGAVERGNELDMGPDDPTGSFVRHGLEPWRRERIRHVIDPSPTASVPDHGDAAVLPVRYVPYNGEPRAVPDRLRTPASRPRVLVVWGRSAPAIFGCDVPALRSAVQCAADLGAEVVIAAPREQVDALGVLPPDTQVVTGLPFQLLLDTCDAVIHHGSACALMTAAAAGVPQLSLALTDDAIATGQRAATSGGALWLPALITTQDSVREAVEGLLSAPLRQAARALRDDLAGRRSPALLVSELQEVAAA